MIAYWQSVYVYARKFPTMIKTSSSEHTSHKEIPNNGQYKSSERIYITRANSQQRSRQAQASIRHASKFPITVNTRSREHTLRDQTPNNGQYKVKRAYFTRAKSQQRSRQGQEGKGRRKLLRATQFFTQQFYRPPTTIYLFKRATVNSSQKQA